MKIGLALSGGGVLGIAHLGVLEEIEKEGIKIDQICGVSAGAIVGALFADGGIRRVNEFWSDLESSGLFKTNRIIFNLNPDKVFTTIAHTLKKHLHAEKFYDLPIKFSCIATDIADGSMHVLKDGNIVEAVMASAAYPGVFPVQRIGDHNYIDGGVTRNLPAGILRKNGADFVIGSSLYSVAKLEKYDKNGELKISRVEVMFRALDVMQKEMAEAEMKSCDFCFNPPVESFRWYNFDKMAEIKKIGEEYAEEFFPKLKKLLQTEKVQKPATWWQRILGQ